VLRQQEALAALGALALRSTDLQQVLAEAARLCASGAGVPFCKILEHRSEHGDLIVRAGVGWREGVVGAAVAKADRSTPAGRAFVTGKPVITQDLRGRHDFVLPSIYAEHGIVLDDSQIADRRQFESTRDGVSCNGGDDRFRERHSRRTHRPRAAAIRMQFVAAGVVGERGQVRARAERTACAEQHRRMPRGVCLEAPERGAQRLGGRTVDRVAARRPLEDDGGDGAGRFDPDVFTEGFRGHDCLRASRQAAKEASARTLAVLKCSQWGLMSHDFHIRTVL